MMIHEPLARRRRRWAAWPLTWAILISGVIAPQASAEGANVGDRADIVRALEDSAAGWSRGDLSAFMRVYEDDAQTAYVKSTDVVHGYGAIHDMYAARFGGAPGAMGRLSMALIDYRPLGRDYALVTGRFDLQRPTTAGGEATGVFTLVFHKSSAGWRIISDHTG